MWKPPFFCPQKKLGRAIGCETTAVQISVWLTRPLLLHWSVGGMGIFFSPSAVQDGEQAVPGTKQASKRPHGAHPEMLLTSPCVPLSFAFTCLAWNSMTDDQAEKIKLSDHIKATVHSGPSCQDVLGHSFHDTGLIDRGGLFLDRRFADTHRPRCDDLRFL